MHHSRNYWIGACELAEFAPKVVAILDDISNDVKLDKSLFVILWDKINKFKTKNIAFIFGKNELEIYVQLISISPCSILIPNVNFITVKSSKTKDLK